MFYLMGSISSNTQPYTIGLTTNKTNLCLTGRTCDAVDRNTPAVERGDESRVIRGGQARGRPTAEYQNGGWQDIVFSGTHLLWLEQILLRIKRINTGQHWRCGCLRGLKGIIDSRHLSIRDAPPPPAAEQQLALAHHQLSVQLDKPCFLTYRMRAFSRSSFLRSSNDRWRSWGFLENPETLLLLLGVWNFYQNSYINQLKFT